MTSEEMLAYAKSVAEGGQVKKADVVAFMKALVEQTEEAQAAAEDEDDYRCSECRGTCEHESNCVSGQRKIAENLAVDPDLQAGGPTVQVEVFLPNLPFEIETTMNGGIHMPRESNRSYTRLEATALIYKIAQAIGFAIRE